MTIRIRMRPAGSPPGAAEEYVFTQDLVTFGRARDNVLVVEDPDKQVSSNHGRLERRAEEWYAIDLRSTNGTLLNGEPLAPDAPALLRDGDRLVLGDFELEFGIIAVPEGADRTMVHFDAERVADRLAAQIAAAYAEALDETPAARATRIRQAVRAEVAGLPPEHARAILLLLRQRMAGTGATGTGPGPGSVGAGAGGDDVARQEELYRAGHEILRSLSRSYVDDEAFRRAEDAGRFGQLLNQTLHITLDWLARCLEGRREFETQFGADVTMMFALDGNPLKNGQDAEQIGRYLLDWRGGRDLSRVRADLEGAFRDLTMHQLGLLAGAQEAVKAVLHRLDPASIEQLAASRSKGWLSVLPGTHREWDYYKQAYRELLEEKTRTYDELISPSIRRGYLAAHQKQLAEPDDGGTGSGPQ